MTGGGPPIGARCYILGAPDAGKTAVLVQIADTLLGRGIACGFHAIDEEPGDILGRFLQRRGFTRRECEERTPQVLEAMGKPVANMPLRLYGDEFTIEDAARDLAAFARKQGRRAAYFVDSVQTARSAHEGAESSLYVAVTSRVRAIRAVTTASRFVTYATSEMGRAAYRSLDAGDRVSDMAAAKESGAIEYSARFMIALRSVPNEGNMTEARVAKNKFGPRTRDSEPGVYLRLDRERQVITEDTAYVAQGGSDGDEQRAAKRTQQAVEDAAVLALVIVDEPGIAKTDAENMLLSRARCGTRRWKAAFSTLRHAIVEQPAPRNRLSLYLDGAKVTDEVMAQVPIRERPRVLGSVPDRELHRAAPSCTGDHGAPHIELHHHPLRSRGGAARGCRPSDEASAPEGPGAAQEEGGQ
jgi:KaiC/GvpD/RAD55 family RecA-like ATPase